MNPFSTLLAKILGWLFLNVLIMTGLIIAICSFQFQVDFSSLVGRRAGESLKTAGMLISQELSHTAPGDWGAMLSQHARIHQVDFVLIFRDGKRFASDDIDIPQSVKTMAGDILKPLPPPPPLPLISYPDGREGDYSFPAGIPPATVGVPYGPMPPFVGKMRPELGPHLARIRRIFRTHNPSRYWTGTVIPVSFEDKMRVTPALLFAVSDSLTGHSFFFDPLPWVFVVVTVALLTTLFWLPMVYHITRPIVRMTRAAEAIARGEFNPPRVPKRNDEVGRLANAIAHMTFRLHGYVKGQKRFLADIAHELGSPIARIRLGLGILEHHLTEKGKTALADVEEDVAHMSNLVEELLSFSKAELTPGKVKTTCVSLQPLVRRVIRRENIPSVDVVANISPVARVEANEDLLYRALANLVRNAIAYAGDFGPIVISDRQIKEGAEITVHDHGEGIPEQYLDRIFDPFFRPEPSRNRDSGGVGLGLYIVKRCIAACNGHVTARNISTGGFAVTIHLQKRT